MKRRGTRVAAPPPATRSLGFDVAPRARGILKSAASAALISINTVSTAAQVPVNTAIITLR
jgi:hypothetical protein